jgi:CO dehydrogenase/acetyl-CoA synthase beta subunit
MVFDAYIEKVAGFTDAMAAQGRKVRRFAVPVSVSGIKERLQVKVGPGSAPGIILREDTYLELGNPEAGSSAFMLFSNQPELVRDGRITVIGPDIQESRGMSLPFGQVLMIGGTELDDHDHEALKHAGFIGDQIQGYMLRSYTQSIWSRVSREVAENGFSLETLGQALMAVYKSGNSKIQTMEILFVTSGRDDIQQLDEIGAQVQKITREMVRETWKIRGYDIDCGADCSSCSDKPVCDDIRDVLKEKSQSRSQDV